MIKISLLKTLEKHKLPFSQKYLTALVNQKSQGEFPPFSSGWNGDCEKYLKQIVGRLTDIYTLSIKADFDHYGSGYSSYVHLYISKKDKSCTNLLINGEKKIESTKGLYLYLCRLAPFAIYGAGEWHTNYLNGKYQGGGSGFLTADDIGKLPSGNWEDDLLQIKNTLAQYRISILQKEELDQSVDFKINIPTILSDPPYKVFDFFFYWED